MHRWSKSGRLRALKWCSLAVLGSLALGACDGEPAPDADNAPAQLQRFASLVFPSGDAGLETDRVRKATQPVTVHVTMTTTKQLPLAGYAEAIEELSSLTGVEIAHPTGLIENPNVLMVLGSDLQEADYRKYEGLFLSSLSSRPDHRMQLVDPSGGPRCFLRFHGDLSTVLLTLVVADTEMGPRSAGSCLLQGILAHLGLINIQDESQKDLTFVTDSRFVIDPRIAQTLTTLYDTRMEPGADRARALKLAREVLRLPEDANL